MKAVRLHLILLSIAPAIVLALLTGRAQAAVEGWEYMVSAVLVGGPRLLSDDFAVIAEGEYGRLHVGDLVAFTGYQMTPPDLLDEPIDYRYALDDATPAGFRLGLRFRRQLDVVWARSWANTCYRVWVDGEEQTADPEGGGILLPDVDLRLDLITVAWRVESLRWKGLAPLVRLGMGWILLSQDGDFRPPHHPAVDNSDSDIMVDLGGGFEWRWKSLQLGAELQGLLFRWESDDDQVPASSVWAWMASMRAGVAF